MEFLENMSPGYPDPSCDRQEQRVSVLTQSMVCTACVWATASPVRCFWLASCRTCRAAPAWQTERPFHNKGLGFRV